REGLGGLPRRQEQRGDAALERGDALLDDVLRRVHDPGVDVARLAEPEQRGGVLGAVEGVGGGLVDRQRPSVGRWIRGLAGVDLLGLERPLGSGVVLFAVGHRRVVLLGTGFTRGCCWVRGVTDDTARTPAAGSTATTHVLGECPHQSSLLSRGSEPADPRLPCSPLQLLNLVITRGTPPRLEGCRPASRGLTLALMTCQKPIAPRRPAASGP